MLRKCEVQLLDFRIYGFFSHFFFMIKDYLGTIAY